MEMTGQERAAFEEWLDMVWSNPEYGIGWRTEHIRPITFKAWQAALAYQKAQDAEQPSNDDGDWYCPKCRDYVDGMSVTHEETHQTCGCTVYSGSEERNKADRLAQAEALLEQCVPLLKWLKNLVTHSDDVIIRNSWKMKYEQLLADIAAWKEGR